MDIKKEIAASTVSALAQKAAETTSEFIFTGKVSKKEVDIKKVMKNSAIVAAGFVFKSDSPIQGTIARIARSIGVGSLVRSGADVVINNTIAEEDNK